MGCAELFLKLHVRFYPTGSAQLAVHQKRIMITYVYMELILLSLLFVTTMRTMLNMLSCDYVNGLDGCTVQTEIACWQGIHWFYASVAVAMVLVILPLCYGHYLTVSLQVYLFIYCCNFYSACRKMKNTIPP